MNSWKLLRKRLCVDNVVASLPTKCFSYRVAANSKQQRRVRRSNRKRSVSENIDMQIYTSNYSPILKSGTTSSWRTHCAIKPRLLFKDIKDILVAINEYNKEKHNNQLMQRKSFEAEISVLTCESSFIKEVNVARRGVEKATDVLSFQCTDEFDTLGNSVCLVVGEVVLNIDALKVSVDGTRVKNAKTELRVLLLHALLHLFGYDHETNSNITGRRSMQRAERSIFKQLFQKHKNAVGVMTLTNR